MNGGNQRQGFTLIEMLVVISVIALLLSILMPVLSSVKETARKTKCLSNVRQLGLALNMYAEDYEGRVPPRDYDEGAVWVYLLKSYYITPKLLHCPSDRRDIDQSYLMNGFIDYFAMHSYNSNWDDFFGAYKSGGFPAISLSSISNLSDTITFGEKRADSDDDSYMDMWPPQYGSDHLVKVSHGKHQLGGNERNAGSNYAFADGSVRFLKYGAAFSPENLWAVTPQYRNAPLPEL